MDRYKIHTIEAVVDRLVISREGTEEDLIAFRTRLTDSIETALKVGEGYVTIQNVTVDPPHDLPFSEHLACPEHGVSIPEIEPRTFSFNTPHGACPDCQGLGSKQEIDPDLLIPDREKSLNDGAIVAMEWNNAREDGKYYWQMLEAVAKHFHIDLNKPINDLTDEQVKVILYGAGDQEINIHYQREDRSASYRTTFEGVIGNLMRRYRETQSEYIRNKISEYMSNKPCPTCHGKRLRPEALAVTVNDANILQVTDWPINQSLEWIHDLMKEDSVLSNRQQIISERILKEIEARLGFLVNVGLNYLTLRRSAGSLSGGEAQRIRLATQIGSRLMGVLYVLDEPSIGLHPRDNRRLLDTLRGLTRPG